MWKNRHISLIVISLLLCFSAQVSLEIITKSPTIDEPTEIFAGYANLKIGRIVYLLGHPPLIRTIAALPLLFMPLKYESTQEHEPGMSTDYVDTHFRGLGFLDENTENGKDKLIIYSSRAMVMLLSVLLGVFIFVWAHELYGIKAGIFALFLFSFEPNLIAHSGLVTTDAGVTVVILITFYFLYKYVKTEGRMHLIVCGVFFGLSLLAKHTSFVVVPAILLLLFIGLEVKPKKDSRVAVISRKILLAGVSFGLIVLIAFTVVAASSGFKDLMVHEICLKKLLPLDVTLPLIVPEYYSKDLDVVFSIGSEGHHPNYLMGQHRSGVWWYLPLVAFLVKTPIPFSLFFGVMLVKFSLQPHKKLRVEELFLLVPLATIVFFFSFISSKTLALRYILSAFPFIIIFSSNIVNFAFERKLLGKVVVLLSIWYVVSAVSIAPHYLAYFNELVGGPINGHKYLVDSNLDWGQDNWLLDDYVKERNMTGYKASLFFRSGPYYKSPEGVVAGVPCEPENGSFIASASALACIFASGTPHELNCLAWLREYEPSDHIGYSIFIYNITPSSIPKRGFDGDILGFVAGKLKRSPVFDFKLRLRNARVYVDGESNLSECTWNANRMQWICSDVDWNTVSWTVNWVDGKPFKCIWAHALEDKTINIDFSEVPVTGNLHLKAAFVDSAMGCLDGVPLQFRVNIGREINRNYNITREQRMIEDEIPFAGENGINVSFKVYAVNSKCKHFCFDAVID